MGFERVRVVDPYDLKACDQAVKEELAADGSPRSSSAAGPALC